MKQSAQLSNNGHKQPAASPRRGAILRRNRRRWQLWRCWDLGGAARRGPAGRAARSVTSSPTVPTRRRGRSTPPNILDTPAPLQPPWPRAEKVEAATARARVPSVMQRRHLRNPPPPPRGLHYPRECLLRGHYCAQRLRLW